MPAGAGYRSKTRDLFSKRHKHHGMPALGTYLRTFKLGEYVDVICDPAIQKVSWLYCPGFWAVVVFVTPITVAMRARKPGNN